MSFVHLMTWAITQELFKSIITFMKKFIIYLSKKWWSLFNFVSLPVGKKFTKNSCIMCVQVVILLHVYSQCLSLSYEKKGKMHKHIASFEILGIWKLENNSRNSSIWLYAFSKLSPWNDGNIFCFLFFFVFISMIMRFEPMIFCILSKSLITIPLLIT